MKANRTQKYAMENVDARISSRQYCEMLVFFSANLHCQPCCTMERPSDDMLRNLRLIRATWYIFYFCCHLVVVYLFTWRRHQWQCPERMCSTTTMNVQSNAIRILFHLCFFIHFAAVRLAFFLFFFAAMYFPICSNPMAFTCSQYSNYSCMIWINLWCDCKWRPFAVNDKRRNLCLLSVHDKPFIVRRTIGSGDGELEQCSGVFVPFLLYLFAFAVGSVQNSFSHAVHNEQYYEYVQCNLHDRRRVNAKGDDGRRSISATIAIFIQYYGNT